MAKFFSTLNPEITEFIQQQLVFFTATAPENGRLNLSPKGMDTFRIVDSTTVAYLDLTGSGNETAAHLAENGRITFMFCSFSAKPLILRLYGMGEVVRPNNPKWPTLKPLFPELPGTRQIIVATIDSLQTSCGFAVPMFESQQERALLTDWAQKKGPDGIELYWREKNLSSIDGHPTHLLDE